MPEMSGHLLQPLRSLDVEASCPNAPQLGAKETRLKSVYTRGGRGSIFDHGGSPEKVDISLAIDYFVPEAAILTSLQTRPGPASSLPFMAARIHLQVSRVSRALVSGKRLLLILARRVMLSGGSHGCGD